MQFEILYLQSTVTVIYSNQFLKKQLFIAFSPAAKCFVPMNFCNNVVWYIFQPWIKDTWTSFLLELSWKFVSAS